VDATTLDRAPAVLAEAQWAPRERAHAERVDALLGDRLERRAGGQAHPVEDFLFSYYSLRPAQLRRWHPGAGVVLLGAMALPRAGWRHHREVSTPDGPGVLLDLPEYLARRGDAVRHVHALLAATASRPPALGCFGLHEWAMVYRQPEQAHRHASWPLRLGQDGTDAVVEAHRIRCTHHDAFRFFTVAARPRNALQPGREDQVALEQPGCLHATMDLYKWAYKLGPAVPGELLLDCFALARDVRALDMQASPYDLAALGYPPVRIETPEGKAEYAAAQRAFADRAAPLRARLITLCEDLLEAQIE
jgi:hypothetical protein